MFVLFFQKMVKLASILLWLVLIRDSAPTLSKINYTMEEYDGSSRIFYEIKGQVYPYDKERELVVYVNLNRISKQSN